MKNKTFSKIILGVFGALTFLIALFILLNSFTKPHVRSIRTLGDSSKAEFSNQRIEIFFNRPIQKNDENNKPIDIKPFIKSTPEFDYNFVWSGNNLLIIPKTILDSSTQYTIEVLPGLTDIYNNKIEDSYSYSFSTKEQFLIYMEKNYPKAADKIVRRNISGTVIETLFESKNIKSFSMNSNYLVVVVTPERTDDIIVLDLDSKKQNDFKLQNTTVSKVDISSISNNFLFIYQDVEIQEQFLLPLSNNIIKIYNIDNSETISFNPRETATDVMDALFSPDGLNILYRSTESFYYLANADPNVDPISIARFTGTGGFNKDGTKIVFSNYDPLQIASAYPFIVTFTSDRETSNLTDGLEYVLDPTFKNKEDVVVYSQRYLELLGTQGIFEIYQRNLNKEATPLFRDSTRSLELPKVSWDDKYLATEAYETKDLLDYLNQRSFISQRKPTKASIIVFDLQKKEKIFEINNAINAAWQK